MEPKIGCYRHYKGGLYRVLMNATDSETGKAVTIYVSLTYGKVWVRPSEMFAEQVEVLDDYGWKILRPRFEYIGDLEKTAWIEPPCPNKRVDGAHCESCAGLSAARTKAIKRCDRIEAAAIEVIRRAHETEGEDLPVELEMLAQELGL